MSDFVQALGVGPQAAAWFALQLLLMIAGALSAGPAPARRGASVALMLSCLHLPSIAPLPPLSRALLACLGMLGLLKLLQLDFEPRWAGHHPLWHGLSPFDVSKARRVPPAVDARLLGGIALHAALLALVVLALLHLPVQAGWLRSAWRLLLGAGLVYAAMEMATEGLRFAHRLAGIAVPPIQRTPILARGVGEFWSQRWNRPVSAWLHQYAFLPLAKRGRPLPALLAAFAVSAALHAWMYYAALGLRAALSVTAFFLLQAPIVLLETKLRVSRWPRPAAHAWTLSWLLLTSPLFVAPLLRGLAL
jgi:hypothetical protein